MRVSKAEFIGGFTNLNLLPATNTIEIAVIGRSNVGKSTFVNRITGQRELARVSATPGHTRELNFFSISVAGTQRERNRAISTVNLVDLPGFGFARFSKSQREQLWEIVHQYLAYRDQLKIICLLNDCRREPENEELGLQRLAFESNRQVLVILTKLDKLKKSERSKQIERVSMAYGLTPLDVELSTSEQSPGELMQRFWARILRTI